MNRQAKFEQACAEAHGMPVETLEAYRMGDTYRLPGIAKFWRFWNMALDSVVVQLPEPRDTLAGPTLFRQFKDSVEAAGLRVAE